jgi:hypothetical protein
MKKKAHDIIDKKDLVNLDFYSNEINIMLRKLRNAQTHCRLLDDLETIDELRHDLNLQKNKLDKFRADYDVEAINSQNIAGKGQFNSTHIENFFQHLQAFEDSFKEVRDRVITFLETVF